MARGLLLDIGGVLIRTPFELLETAERRRGLPVGALGPRGIFDLAADPEFRQVRDGTLAERAYWARRAERAAGVLDIAPDTRAFMQVLYDLEEDAIVRPEVAGLAADARAAGITVGLLTNDLVDFHGDDWVARISVFHTVDVLVDGSITGDLKPAPEAFRHAIDALGLPPAEIVFVDDQPVNVAGARAIGLQAIEMDVTDPAAAVAAARALLGVP
jgi:putative hydrolase of the HAD superfamily